MLFLFSLMAQGGDPVIMERGEMQIQVLFQYLWIWFLEKKQSLIKELGLVMMNGRQIAR